ncbi:cation:proton antiporter [Arundinibacter roseus]|uniref:Cation:proton antiporter n=1 Tax=Arundinibacter roseus TaxID=2070510 RepID=A0A4V2XAG3_9BACT|nr:cation:proton antiporter [Arundinibacter roseus]TDB67465.1 cation:proton antiporter [Arundinibacter roseus]
MTDFFKLLMHEFDLPLRNPVLIFSLILFIILLSPILLRKLNIPSIIGLIISGVVVGPFGLNILEKTVAIDLFSTIGLLYIMFIAGLELDLNQFKAFKNKSILFGFLTFIIPISIGFPVCHYILGYDFNASFLTASMFATHTLVAYPIVSKLGISKNESVAITVGGTILTDTAVLILLAVVIGSNEGSLNQEFWLRLGFSLIIFSAIMFYLIPRIAQWFFRTLESEKHSHYIFVLSVVFFAAFLAEVAGVEPIIGAFVAGLALNKLIPHSSALMNRIEFIGNSLFIPFFLISVGMLVNLQVIFNGADALIVAGTLSIVAFFGKWLAAWFTQILCKYSKAQRQLIFGLSSSHAAATLAIILVGFNAGILDENILNGTIILILITCVTASFVTEKAGKQIVIESADDTSDIAMIQTIDNEHILLPIADMEDVEKLLEFSIYIRDKKSTSPVSILSVVSNDEEAEHNIMKARNKLEEFVMEASASETNVNIITTIDHNPACGIARISKEILADIVILGWPQKNDFLTKLVGEKLDSILNGTDKTIFVSDLQKPLVLHKRIISIVPPFAELENGFELWIIKTGTLAEELSIPMIIYCNAQTKKAIERVIKKFKITSAILIHFFDDWEDLLILSKSISDDDLIILVSARKGSASYSTLLENIPVKMEKHFGLNNKLVIYPQQFSHTFASTTYKDVSSEPINLGIEAIQKIGKGIGNIFKKEEEEKENI